MLSAREFQWGITSMRKEYWWAIVETIGEKRGLERCRRGEGWG